jgi:hypothetical protein
MTDERNDLALQPYVNWASIMRSDAADFEFSVGTQVDLDLRQELLRNPTYLPSQSYDLDWNVNPALSWRLYLPKSDAFVETNGSLDADFVSSADDASVRHVRVIQWQASGEGGIALGYGRMRDAWPLAKAVRIADILAEEGALDHKLSDDELRELAGFISRSWKLFYAHDNYARYYYDSLSAYLARTRAIERPLLAYVLFRLDESQLGYFYRPFGWRAYVEISGSGNAEAATVTENDFTEHSSHLGGSSRSDVGLQYARLFGLRTIVTGELEYTLPWPITLRGWHRHIVNAQAQASYIVTDRFSASLSAFYNWTDAFAYSPGLSPFFEYEGRASAEVRYYLADRFWLSGSAGWSASGGADNTDGRWVQRVPGRTFSVGAEIRWGPDSPYLLP